VAPGKEFTECRKANRFEKAMAVVRDCPRHSALLAASAPKMLLSWKNPNYSGGRFANILVLALNGKRRTGGI